MILNRWKLLPLCPQEFSDSAGISPLLAQLLYNRGLSDPAEAQAFLSGGSSLRHDPFLLPDIHQALSRIFRGLFSGEKMAVFGDFDADGITSTLILVEGLRALGATVVPYLPSRIEEGHGLNVPALEDLKGQGVSLIITVDCGITSYDEVEAARGMGVDVVVSDHHAVSSAMPHACAVVNPKRPDSTYPYSHLAGAGVALKLMEAISLGMGRPKLDDDAFALAAIGTIADMSPLTGENRYLVKRGLAALNRSRRPGIVELERRSGTRDGGISSETVAWGLVPRLNAAGRIEHARIAYNLLHTDMPEEAAQFADQLEMINKERQSQVDIHWKRVRERVLASPVEDPMVVVFDAECPGGICGLIASRLVDEFNRPAAMVSVGESSSRGSCRSIPQFDVVAALGQCADLFTQFGGHPAAAGFSLPSKDLESAKQRLVACAREKLAGADLSREVAVDAEVDPRDIVGEAFKSLDLLAPYGQGNPEPVFLARSLQVVDARQVGNGGHHLKLRLRKDGIVWPAIAFDFGTSVLKPGQRLDILYNAQVNHWGNRETMELSLVDFRPAG